MNPNQPIPPNLANRFLNWFLRDELAEEVQGDLEEQFYRKLEESTLFQAKLNYWFQVINYLRPFAISKSSNSQLIQYAMYRNYIKISWRKLMADKWFSLVNMVGLALGIAICTVISLYTHHELSYDKFHENHANIYQIQINGSFVTTAPLASLISEKIPDQESMLRIDDSYGGGQSALIIVDENESHKKIKVKNVFFADSNVFDFFSFQVLYGDPGTALKEPYSIVLTRKTSQILFGTINSIGKTLEYIGDRSHLPEMNMTVTAIVEDPPTNSSLSFSALSSFSTLHSINPTGVNIEEDWSNWGYMTYAFIEDQNYLSFQDKLSQLWKQKTELLWPEEEPTEIGIVPLTDASFYGNNKLQLILLIQATGVFILILAIINFINLTIAKSTTRSKEIVVRKVVGSARLQLIKQFLAESVFISILIVPIAIILIYLGKSHFYQIINKQIPIDIFQQPLLGIIFIACVLIIGLLAGIYPAIRMTSHRPGLVVNGAVSRGKKGSSFRFGLFVFQFVISVCLVTGTLLISDQIDFFKTKPLGFDPTNIIHCNQSQQINDKYDVFKQRLLQNPNVMSLSRSNGALGQDLNIGLSYEVDGVLKPFLATTVDPDFIETMGIPIIEGRNFRWDIQSDLAGAILVNESFVNEFGLETALGTEVKLFDFLSTQPKIIGVVEDFHYNSFHEKIEPSALWYVNWNGRINIKIKNDNIAKSIDYIEKVWKEISPQIPFEYEFLDDTYNDLYKSEERLQRIFSYTSFIAIIISCFGLFGLISESAQQRIKEIGIRKVLGSSITNLIGLLTKDYIKWVVIASIIAWPIAYFIIKNWLQNFDYRIDISIWPFLYSGLVALLITSVTLSFHAIKAALANPVKCLRSE